MRAFFMMKLRVGVARMIPYYSELFMVTYGRHLMGLPVFLEFLNFFRYSSTRISSRDMEKGIGNREIFQGSSHAHAEGNMCEAVLRKRVVPLVYLYSRVRGCFEPKELGSLTIQKSLSHFYFDFASSVV
jgi:hypothetical protein